VDVYLCSTIRLHGGHRETFFIIYWEQCVRENSEIRNINKKVKVPRNRSEGPDGVEV
jgi:hypothetical protein